MTMAHESGDSEDLSLPSDPALAALLLLESSGCGSGEAAPNVSGRGGGGSGGGERSASSSAALDDDDGAAAVGGRSLDSSHNGDAPALEAASLGKRPFKLHPPAEAPLCADCAQGDAIFFDPYCRGCRSRLHDPDTGVSQLFAVLRQWVPAVQCNILLLVNEILSRGAGVDDMDVVSGCTLLHFAARAGAATMGDPAAAGSAARLLLVRGANYYMRGLWTSMMPLHYAAYFNVPSVVSALLEHKTDVGLYVDFECADYDGATALHLACANMSYEAAKVLLEKGASLSSRDKRGRIPYDLIPNDDLEEPDSQLSRRVRQMRKLLNFFESSAAGDAPCPNYDGVHSKVTLQAARLQLGDRVNANGKAGILRFCGAVHFSPGVWAGVELDDGEGKSDGSLEGVTYFACPAGKGLFVPMTKVARAGQEPPRKRATSRHSSVDLSKGKVDVSRVTSRTDTGLHKTTRSRSNSFSQEAAADVDVGDRVTVSGYRGRGIVRYVGKMKNSSGIWYGIELDHPIGKNDGSVDGERYFTCKSQRGVFCTAIKVKRVLGSRAASNESLNSLNALHGPWKGRERHLSTGGGSQSSLDSCASSGGGARSGASSTASASRDPAAATVSSGRSIGSSSKRSSAGGTASTGAATTTSLSARKQQQQPQQQPPRHLRLEEGCSVLYSGELAIIRYIGPTDFADGVWLGLELRSAKGRHDGAVQGRRYFSCKPLYGLLVKPSRITMRGVNGARLIAECPPALSPLPGKLLPEQRQLQQAATGQRASLGRSDTAASSSAEASYGT